MNKLRTLVLGGSAFLLVAVAWAFLTYGATPANAGAYLRVLAVAALLPAIPRALAAVKYVVGRRLEARENGGGLSAERDSIFVSESAVGDAERTLARLADAISAEEDFDGVSRDEFDEGPGLTVRHTGFHNSFVRVTGDGRLVVTGGSTRTHSLADVVERVASLSLRQKRTHPFRTAAPVRGAPRAFLGLFMAVLLLFGVASVGAVGYPADAYNASERVALVGFDVRADADPGYGETDALLGKSAFLVDALGEEAVEIGWDKDAASKLERHAAQSLALSSTVSDNLATARDRGLSPAQADRAATIRSDLHAAECRVAGAVDKRLRAGKVTGDLSDLRRMRSQLRDRAASAGAACGA